MRQLLRRLDLLGRKFGATEVAWQISPVLNSAGRMGEPSAAVRLLVAGPAEAEAAAAELAALNTKRRSLGETSWSLALDQARSSLDRTEGRCVLVHDERIPRGITGILASRLQGFFKAPAVVIASAGPTAIGSIRANRGGMISGFFERHAPSFSSWGGHDFAGGFSLEKSRLAAFVESFFETSSEIAAPEGAEETLAVDAEVPVAHLTPDVQRIVELLEPFGEGNPPLLVLTRGMRVAHAELIGKREAVHLKLLLEAGATRWPAVWWNAASRFPGEFSIGDTIDVVYRMGRNTWGGGETLQLTVQDLRR
jgi:single-stranded-DNA-specific exonuclease